MLCQKRITLAGLFILLGILIVAAVPLPGNCRDIKVIFRPQTPPYVFQEGYGIAIDIVRESLAISGYRVEPVLVPLNRGIKMFSDGLVDANAIVKKNIGLKNAWYSDPFITYRNYAIALKRPGHPLSVSSMEDLGRVNVIAFQYASLYLENKFSAVVKKNKKYTETADQKKQVLLLLKGRTDVAVMEQFIFHYYRNVLAKEGLITANSTAAFIDLFQPSDYLVAFRDKKIRNDFNNGLKALRKNGRYGQIYQQYTAHIPESKR